MEDNGMVPDSQFLVYRDEAGAVKIDVRLEDETVWLTQQALAELFQTALSNINEHISNIYDEGELEPEATQRHLVILRQEGSRTVRRPVLHYNLDMIISVGYRVKSGIATRFRIWATQQLRELIVKGFVLDDERLKNPDTPFDYFEELTRRIQEIRTSERRFYRKITDIYATSVDYDPTTDESVIFFKTVQNKMHWAINEQTAAEIILSRANADEPHMGLTTWRHKNIRKADTEIAKNYLQEHELRPLNNLAEQYVIFAEGQAQRRIPMHMADWIAKLDQFLTLNDREILENAGTVSHDQAIRHAYEQYTLFVEKRRQLEDERPREYDAMLEGGNVASEPAKERQS